MSLVDASCFSYQVLKTLKQITSNNNNKSFFFLFKNEFAQ
jgi:hypothetical protein